MSVHSSLILDHFFFAASDEAFAELKTLFEQLECRSHQKVATDGDSWEGLYVWTRGGYYLEILKERRNNCSGLCQKPLNPLRYDAREIIAEMPDLPWKSFERSVQGQKWFTAVSCDDYLDLTTPFNTWVMHYYPMYSKHKMTFHKYEIERMDSFQIDADASLKDRIKTNSLWFNGEKEFAKESYQFKVQTYFGDGMNLQIDFNPFVKGTQFRSLRLKFMQGFDPSALLATQLNHFDLEPDGDSYILRAKGARS